MLLKLYKLFCYSDDTEYVIAQSGAVLKKKLQTIWSCGGPFRAPPKRDPQRSLAGTASFRGAIKPPDKIESKVDILPDRIGTHFIVRTCSFSLRPLSYSRRFIVAARCCPRSINSEDSRVLRSAQLVHAFCLNTVQNLTERHQPGFVPTCSSW